MSQERSSSALEALENRSNWRIHWASTPSGRWRHHFLPGYSTCPAEQFLTAVAMLTKSASPGHGIMHMPFKINHPFARREHVATSGYPQWRTSRGLALAGQLPQEELFGFRVDQLRRSPGKKPAYPAENVDAAGIEGGKASTSRSRRGV
jgi:hypothetical protein